MEARASFGRSSVSKTFVAAILVIVAIGLAVMSAYVAKGLGGTSASQTHFAQPAPGTVLRQDSPALSEQTVAPGSVLRQDNPVAGKQLTDRAYDANGRVVGGRHGR
jgi:hypothetical protein